MSTTRLFSGDSRAQSYPRYDVMIADPPYSAHVHKNATSCGPLRRRRSPGRLGAHHRDLGFDHLSPALRRHVCQLAAGARRWSLIYSDVEGLTWWRIGLIAAGAKYVRTIP